MKKLYTLVAAVILTANLWAQAPQKFSYQAVIRNATNSLVSNQKVGVKISILQGSTTSIPVYTEQHAVATNENGLVSIEIGGGTVGTGEFSKIDWSKGPFYVRTETDPTGGTNYTISGESQLLSVPYALFAANSQPGPKGDTGAEGPAGKDGVKGVDGKDGAVGPIGPKGDTGAVGAQGTAGLPGKDGINGKDGLNGADGKDGKDGAVGPIGPKGDTGAVGAQGTAGLPGKDGKDGINGKDGAVGPIGPKGDTGAVGAQGTAGLPGKDGKDGAVGPIGPKGDTGAVGAQGTAGLPGKDGKDGINGKDGLNGKDGAVGPIGPKGDTGAVGAQGTAGLPGKDGKDGINGKDGLNGKDGAAGPIGPKGDTGTVGPQGSAGVPGKDGTFPTGNKKGEMNYWDGNTWISVTPGNNGQLLTFCDGVPTWTIGGQCPDATPPTSGYGPNITDVDGNSYKTVYIGTQQWMGENLKTSKYSDGTPIPNVTDNTQWSNITTGAWCNYNNSDSLGNIYGKLYNWYAVSTTTNGNKNVCPSGWHVPSDTEWNTLSDYLGGAEVAGGKMKEVGTSKWISPNTDATNTTLFSGIPGGYRGNDGNNNFIGSYGYWWSSSDYNADITWNRSLNESSGNVNRYSSDKVNGLSVRCLKGEPTPTTQGSIQNIDCGGATNNDTLTANTAASEVSSMLAYTGGNGGTYASQAIASTGVTGLTATLSAGTLANGEGNLTYTITGTPTASGTATFDISIGGKTCTLTRTIVQPTNGFGPNISDIDGNSYKTVYIGTQQWMGENLKTAKYNDGTPIPNVTDNTVWPNLTTGAWCNYNNSDSLGNIYGKLYNWYTVNSNKVCPNSWHVPTESEWTILSNYLGGSEVAGGKMKEVGTLHWSNPNTDATNENFFTALPGGTKYPDGHFDDFGTWGTWWSNNNSRYVDLNCTNGNLMFRSNSNQFGFAIRCLKD
jgi:uncharacterized protein (TIGR02145 family)